MPIFMQITGASGPLSGGGVFPGHSDWIHLDHFSFGQSASTVMATVVDGKQPIANFGASITVKRQLDIVSPKLMNWLRTGDQRKVQIDHCTQEGTSLFSLTLTGAELIDYSVDNQGTDGIPENLTIAWQNFTLSTLEMGSDGKQTNASPRSPFEYIRPNLKAADSAAGHKPKDDPKDRAEKAFDVALLASLSSQVADSVSTPSEQASALGDSSILHARSRTDTRAPDMQQNRVLEIDAINGKEFTLLSFEGSEAVSRLFEFTLELSSPDDAIQASDVVGQEVGFRIVDSKDIEADKESPDRNFHGRVRRFWAGDVRDDGSRRYRLEVVPWMWLLTKRSDCRVFQEKTVVEIIEQVFKDANLTAFEKAQVKGTYPKLDYCVQYRETDFEFVSRLLEEYGILYFFQHEAKKHTLVLADATTVHLPCIIDEVVQSKAGTEPKRVYSWERRYEMVAKKSMLRDYNYLTPADTLQAVKTSSVSLQNNTTLELFDYPGAYTKLSDGEKIAMARIQAEEARFDIAVGRGNCDFLAVGGKFTFKEHEVKAEEQKTYVVSRIDHRAGQFDDGRAPSVDYHSTFSCVPDTVLLRPPVTRERPRIQGPQTAVVVGAKGEEIDTDKYGRIKVQFHWDRVGKKDEKSSCWLRVAQPIAGKGWGALALPRIGQEVLVQFLEGDPDRPLVVGSLYNETALPLDLPGKKNSTLLRTRSTKQGSDETFSELRFDDTKGSEQVFFHAEKDMEREVEHDDKLTVGKEGDGSRTVLIEKDSTLTINKGNRTETLKEGNDTLTIEKGDRTVKITSGKDVLEVTAGDQSITLGGKGDIAAKTGFTIKVSGGKVLIEASPGIELSAGSSSIKLEPAGVTIKGTMVTIEGTAKSEVKAAMVNVEASGILSAKGSLTKIG